MQGVGCIPLFLGWWIGTSANRHKLLYFGQRTARLRSSRRVTSTYVRVMTPSRVMWEGWRVRAIRGSGE